MSKTFGKACDFYRARVLTLEEEIPPDFDWRDDVLYRQPRQSPGGIKINYCLQVVDLDSRQNHVLKQYANRKEASQRLKKIEEDLKELTKMEFEKKYDLHLTDEIPPSEDIEETSGGETNGKTDVPRNLS